MRAKLVAVGLAIGALVWPGLGLGVTFTVNNPGDFVDNNPGDGFCLGGSPIQACGLRAAVMEANALGGIHTIDLPAGHYKLTVAGADEDQGYSGDLDILAAITIDGAGAGSTAIDALGMDRALDVSGGRLVMDGVTITGGLVAGTGLSGSGGGILVRALAEAHLDRTVVDGNSATQGGGVYFAGLTMTLDDSAVTDNVTESFALGGGGAIAPSGGGIRVSSDDFFVRGSTVARNRCGPGGAGGCDGVAGVSVTDAGSQGTVPGVVLRNSTISGNTPGGVWLEDSTAWIEFSTIADNPGGGLTFFETASSGLYLFVENSVVSGNLPDCNVLAGSTGTWILATNHNLDSDGTCGLLLFAGDLPNTDPMLHSLDHFEPPLGRVARSRHPKWFSPVVDRSPFGRDNVIDQNGSPRPLDAVPPGLVFFDLGSIEVWPCSGTIDELVENVSYDADTSVQACRSITTGDSVTVEGGIQVTFVARDSIVIGNGFSVLEGGTFTARFLRTAGAGL